MTPLQKLSTRVRVTGVSLIASLAVALLAMAFGSAPAKADESFSLVKVMVPDGLGSGNAMHQDIAWVDPDTNTLLLADRANNSVEVYDTQSNTWSYNLADPNDQGPNGVVADGRGDVWYGDNASHLVGQSISNSTAYCNQSTVQDGYHYSLVTEPGASGRADELAYDSADHIIMLANPDAQGSTGPAPYVTFWKVSTSGCNFIGSKVFTSATNGIEQSQYDAKTGMFYLNIPQVDQHQGIGEILVIDPNTEAVVKTLSAPQGCEPGGLALGPNPDALIVCSKGGINNAAAVINLRSGSLVARFPSMSGGDEGWYNPGDNHYFAAVNHNDPAEVGVIDANGNQADLEGAMLTNSHAHNVAADAATNSVYVPVNGPLASMTSDEATACAYGCVAVYQASNDDAATHHRGLQGN